MKNRSSRYTKVGIRWAKQDHVHGLVEGADGNDGEIKQRFRDQKMTGGERRRSTVTDNRKREGGFSVRKRR